MFKINHIFLGGVFLSELAASESLLYVDEYFGSEGCNAKDIQIIAIVSDSGDEIDISSRPIKLNEVQYDLYFDLTERKMENGACKHYSIMKICSGECSEKYSEWSHLKVVVGNGMNYVLDKNLNVVLLETKI